MTGTALAYSTASMLTLVVGAWALSVWTELFMKRRLRTERVEGVVVGGRTWSETHVSGSSSGGGGYISPLHGGHVSAARMSVSSNVTSYHQFFVRRQDGYQCDVTIPTATEFPTHEGQHVAVVNLVGAKGRRIGWGMRNRDTGVVYWSNASDFARAQVPLIEPLGFLVVGTVTGLATTASIYADFGDAGLFVALLTLLGTLIVAGIFVGLPLYFTEKKVLRQKHREAGQL